MRLLLLALLAVVFSVCLAACAGTTRSTRYEGTFPAYDPNSFPQLSLALDPNDPSTLYAGTWTGLFKSSDAAASWQRLSEVGAGVDLVVIDPAPPSTVYVWTDLTHLHRSDDGGATWTDLSGPDLPMLLGGQRRMWMDRTSAPSTLYMHGGRTKPQEVVGTWRSTDRGESWTPLTASEAARAEGLAEGRDLPPAAKQTLDAFLASFRGTVTDADTSEVVRRTPSDNGPLPVIVVPEQPTTLYVVMYHGVYKSTDSGKTWRKASDGLIP